MQASPRITPNKKCVTPARWGNRGAEHGMENRFHWLALATGPDGKSTEGKTMQIEIELAAPATPNPAIAGWLLVADEAERAGLSSAAVMYRKTARSIEIKQETGIAVCACCFKPFGQGTLHH